MSREKNESMENKTYIVKGDSWVDIAGYDGRYRVSNMGEIASIFYWGSTSENTKLLRQHESNGYLVTTLYKNGNRKTLRVSRLVAKHFIPNPLNLHEVNHKNGNKLDNRAENLEWSTGIDNIRHGMTELGYNHGAILLDLTKGDKVVTLPKDKARAFLNTGWATLRKKLTTPPFTYKGWNLSISKSNQNGK